MYCSVIWKQDLSSLIQSSDECRLTWLFLRTHTLDPVQTCNFLHICTNMQQVACCVDKNRACRLIAQSWTCSTFLQLVACCVDLLHVWTHCNIYSKLIADVVWSCWKTKLPSRHTLQISSTLASVDWSSWRRCMGWLHLSMLMHWICWRLCHSVWVVMSTDVTVMLVERHRVRWVVTQSARININSFSVNDLFF